MEPIQQNQNDNISTPPAPSTPIDPSNPMAFLDEKGNEALNAAYWDTRPVTIERRAAHDAAVARVQQQFALAEHKAPAAPIPPTLEEYNKSSQASPLDALTVAQRAAYYDPNDPNHDEAVALAEKATQDFELKEGEKALLESLPPLPAGKSWDTGMAAEVIAIAEESGVPEVDLNAALEAYAKHGSPTILSYEQAEAMMRQKWGADYETKLSAAKDALRDFPVLLDFLDRTRLGNDPAILMHLAEKGVSRQAIQAEIDRVTYDPKSAYRAGNEAEVERVRLLFKRLYA